MSIKLLLLIVTLGFSTELLSQIELKRPSGTVGIQIVDSLVARSFDVYEKIFEYHTRVNAGEILDEKELCDIELVFSRSEILLKEAFSAKQRLKNESFLTRAKGTIQLERAKRAVYYSKEASTEMLLSPKSRYGELSRN